MTIIAVPSLCASIKSHWSQRHTAVELTTNTEERAELVDVSMLHTQAAEKVTTLQWSINSSVPLSCKNRRCCNMSTNFNVMPILKCKITSSKQKKKIALPNTYTTLPIKEGEDGKHIVAQSHYGKLAKKTRFAADCHEGTHKENHAPRRHTSVALVASSTRQMGAGPTHTMLCQVHRTGAAKNTGQECTWLC